MTDQNQQRNNVSADLSSQSLDSTQTDHTTARQNSDNNVYDGEFLLPDEIEEERNELDGERQMDLELEENEDQQDITSAHMKRLFVICARFGITPIAVIQLIYYLNFLFVISVGIRRMYFRFVDLFYEVKIDQLWLNLIYPGAATIVDFVFFIAFPITSFVIHTLTLVAFYFPKLSKGLKRKPSKVVRLILVPQLAAFDSAAYGTRKIIVSTNVAETSVTISGVCYVIDCGFMKLRVYNTDNGVETLQTVKTSKSSAKQRAGRAGRIHPGKCYRLYPEEEYQKLLPSQVPELQRTDLSQVILTLKSLGINNFLKFQFPSRPPSQPVIQALNSLFALGAIDEDGMLTKPLGHTMSTFPLPPMHVKVLVSAATYECSEEMAAVLAMMQIQNVFIPGDNRHMAEVTKRKFAVEEGDHLTNLNVYTNFVENGKSSKWCRDHYVNYKGLCSAHNICEQLKRYLRKFDIPLKSCKGLIGETARIRRCLLTGFFSQCARYDHTGQYVTLRDSIPFKVYKGSTVMYRKDYPKYVVFTDVLQNSIRDLSVIELEWLREIAGHYYDFGHDPKNNMEENYEADQMGNLN